jgi:hypothetical protein
LRGKGKREGREDLLRIAEVDSARGKIDGSRSGTRTGSESILETERAKVVVAASALR